MFRFRKYPPPPPPQGGKGGNFRGVGVASRILFLRAPCKIQEQAVSYFTVNRFLKAIIIVFTDDLLIAVS